MILKVVHLWLFLQRGAEILRELVATSYESLKADKTTQAKQKDDVELIQGALKQALSKADSELKADGEACGEVHVTPIPNRAVP